MSELIPPPKMSFIESSNCASWGIAIFSQGFAPRLRRDRWDKAGHCTFARIGFAIEDQTLRISDEKPFLL